MSWWRRVGPGVYRRWRNLTAPGAGLASLALLAGLALAEPTATPGPAPRAEDAAVEQQVLDELRAQGTTTFWVYLQQEAELGAAAAIVDRAAQGRYVYQQLTRTAAQSQAGLIAMLNAEGAAHESFWIANTIKVTGDADLLERIVARPEVAQVTADRAYQLPDPAPDDDQAGIAAVEWNIDRINAPQVWDTFGFTGEDVVVATIDSGVQFDHPALVRQYRGNRGDGTFDHNYHWYDPSTICGNPSLAPCDNTGHGTHVTGTMVGDDGENQIGVAPGATWIAAKGCEANTCTPGALLASGQFMLAPTDLQGNNPDPERRPHVVNNSWGGGATSDPWYQPTVRAWVAAGIFPQFASGNPGPSCGLAANPGNLPESYAAGAFDINDRIYVNSGRGPSAWDGIVKPNIAAPGVSVRSSVPNDDYQSFTGTSMASPHVSGAVALIWSAAPALERDIDTTRELLDQTAIDTEDLTCGGEPSSNNVWGQGRLDAFAAVDASPHGPTGILTGTVTDAGSGKPVAGASITITGAVDRERTTGPDGAYAIRLPVGEYAVTASAFGYEPQDARPRVVEGETTTRDFALAATASVTISGQVTDGSGHGWPMYAEIDVVDTPVRGFTDPFTGEYRLTVPAQDTYTIVARPQYPGYRARTETTEVGDRDLTLDLTLVVDSCELAPGYQLEDECRPVEGGLVLGHVTDANTGAGVTAATVASDNRPGDNGRSMATPDDPANDEGFYWLFSSLTSRQPFTATASNYVADPQTANVVADATNQADFVLAAGQLAIDPAGVEAQLRLGRSGERTFTVTNTGTAPAELELFERRGAFEILGANGPTERVGPLATASQGAEVKRVEVPGSASYASHAGAEPGTADRPGSVSPSQDAWEELPDLPRTIMDNNLVRVGDELYSFGGVDGTAVLDEVYRLGGSASAWERLDDAPAPLQQSAQGVIDGLVYLAGSWSGLRATTWIYDPETGEWSVGADLPEGRAAAGAAVLDGHLYVVGGCTSSGCAPMASDVFRYDPVNDRWETLPPYPEPAAFLSCGGVAGVVACAGGVNEAGGLASTYVFDPSSRQWLPGADLPVDLWGSGYHGANDRLLVSGGAALDGAVITNEGYAYDPDDDEWQPLPAATHSLYRGGSACGFYRAGGATGGFDATPSAEVLPGFGDCANLVEVSWLDISPMAGPLDPGDRVTVTVSMDAGVAEVDQPGAYAASVGIRHNTPYPMPAVGATMHVTPPNNWGKVEGTVTGVSCQGDQTPLAGATVQINGSQRSVALRTDGDGRYAYWFSVKNNPLHMIVATTGHHLQSRDVNVAPKQTEQADFALRAICPGGREDRGEIL